MTHRGKEGFFIGRRRERVEQVEDDHRCALGECDGRERDRPLPLRQLLQRGLRGHDHSATSADNGELGVDSHDPALDPVAPGSDSMPGLAEPHPLVKQFAKHHPALFAFEPADIRHGDQTGHPGRLGGERMPRHLHPSGQRIEPATQGRSHETASGRLAACEYEGTAGDAEVERSNRRLRRARQETFGAESGTLLAMGPQNRLAMLAQVFALDIHVGQRALQPARHPPGRPTEQGHDRGHQRHSHEEGVECDPDRKAKGDRLDGAGALRHEGEEDEEHDESGSGDYAGAIGEPAAHRLLRIAGVNEFLAHTGDQEHLIVHGEAEEHRHQDYRHEAQDGTRILDVEHIAEPSPLKDRDDDSEGCRDRQ